MVKSTPDRAVITIGLGSIFGEVCFKAASQVTAISGLRKCDSAPLDRNNFSEADFIATKVTVLGDHTDK